MFASRRDRRSAATCAPGCQPLARTDGRPRRAGHPVWRDAPGGLGEVSLEALDCRRRSRAGPRSQACCSTHGGLDAVPRSVGSRSVGRSTHWRFNACSKRIRIAQVVPERFRHRRCALGLTSVSAGGRRAASWLRGGSLPLRGRRTDNRTGGCNSRTSSAVGSGMTGACRAGCQVVGLHHDAARQPWSDADRLLDSHRTGRNGLPREPDVP